MRESLKKSIAHSPAGNFERYPKGSLVLCNACALPVFRLDLAISLGDRMGAMARAFKPVSLADLAELEQRVDVDAGITARVRSMTMAQRLAHLALLHEVKAGDPALCPACGDCFVQVVAVGKDEVLDRSYTVELLTVPPLGGGRATKVSGRLPGTKDWLQ